MSKLYYKIFDIWYTAVQLLLIWLVIALFIPGLNWYDHVYMLASYLIGYPAYYIFTFFGDYSDHVRTTWNPDSNPIEDGVNLFLMLGSIASAFLFPVIFLVHWLGIVFVSVAAFIPKSVRNTCADAWTPEAENNWHLLSGHTTIQDVYDAEVQANAIVSALKKNR